MSKWEDAQKLEPIHWLEKKEDITDTEYRKKIEQRSLLLQRLLSSYIDCSNPGLTVLEIGGGATQLIDFFPSRNRHAVDPLADMYTTEFADVLNQDVIWKQAKAEELGYEDDTFDIVIARNVLDHVESLETVLSEIRRVVKKDGIVYVGLNVFSGPLYLYRYIHKDKEHPYTFSHASINRALLRGGFGMLEVVRDSALQMTHFTELESQAFVKKLLRSIFLGLNCYHFSEFVLSKGSR